MLYFAAEQAVRSLAEHTVARSPGRGPVADLVTGQAELPDGVNGEWGSRFRRGGMNDARAARPCGRDPPERLAWIVRGWRAQTPTPT